MRFHLHQNEGSSTWSKTGRLFDFTVERIPKDTIEQMERRSNSQEPQLGERAIMSTPAQDYQLGEHIKSNVTETAKDTLCTVNETGFK
jgi:hypothetical protein